MFRWFLLKLVGPSRDHDLKELKKEKPGIDREVVAVQHIQILDLCYFLKLSNKCHEIWPSDHFRGDPGKCSCFSKICTVQATLGVKNKWFFIRVPRGLFGFQHFPPLRWHIVRGILWISDGLASMWCCKRFDLIWDFSEMSRSRAMYV